ncbi:flagellar biosynthetic protein FliR [Alkaliphilus crotonatoxidans]
MDQLLEVIQLNLHIFILIVFRVTGIFVAAPIFARSNFPALMKIGLSVTIGFILMPVLGNSAAIEIGSVLQLALYVLTEFIAGILIGFIAFMYFSALYLAGTIIDTQMGFGMVNVFDPQTNTQIPVMGNFYNNLLSLLFVVLNGHHLLIRALTDSFQILPLGTSFTLGSEGVAKITVIMTEFFVLAVKFSAPVLLTILLANVLLGILARTMPQMNVFIVGLPLKIFVGMLTVIISLQFMLPFTRLIFDKLFTSIYEMLKILAKG